MALDFLVPTIGNVAMESGSAGEDYEGLPENLPASTHMCAGALAGILEHSIMYPVDCVKTRMQAMNPSPEARYSGIAQALRTIVYKEGMGRSWKGVNSVIIGAGPAHALYFACYEKLKFTFSGTKQGTAATNALAGGTATLFHDAIMVPSDVVKQRLQMFRSPYRGVFDCVRRVYAAEGAKAFYRSYTTQIAMNVPFQAAYFTAYELLQDRLNPDRVYLPLSHVVSGAGAGALAATLTNPFDVCKTLLNTQEECCRTQLPGATVGLKEAMRKVYSCHGMSGFTRGLRARIVFQMPSAAISWSVYEFFKHAITQGRSAHNCTEDGGRGGGESPPSIFGSGGGNDYPSVSSVRPFIAASSTSLSQESMSPSTVNPISLRLHAKPLDERV